MNARIEQLQQLCTVTFDDDIISKDDLLALRKAQLAQAHSGWNWINTRGLEVLLALDLLSERNPDRATKMYPHYPMNVYQSACRRERIHCIELLEELIRHVDDGRMSGEEVNLIQNVYRNAITALRDEASSEEAVHEVKEPAPLASFSNEEIKTLKKAAAKEERKKCTDVIHKEERQKWIDELKVEFDTVPQDSPTRSGLDVAIRHLTRAHKDRADGKAKPTQE